VSVGNIHLYVLKYGDRGNLHPVPAVRLICYLITSWRWRRLQTRNSYGLREIIETLRTREYIYPHEVNGRASQYRISPGDIFISGRTNCISLLNGAHDE